MGMLWKLTGTAGGVLLLAGLLSARRAAARAALSAVIGYWLCAHALMAVGESYLLPLLPVIGVLIGSGAGAAGAWLGLGGWAPVDPVPRLWRGVLAGSRVLAGLGYMAGVVALAHEVWILPLGSGQGWVLPASRSPVFSEALRAQAEGRYAEAIQAFSEAIRQAGDSRAASRPYADRGVARFLAGDRDGAVQDLRQAIKLDFYNAEAHLSLGAVWAKSREPRRALSACGRAIKLAQAGGSAGRGRLLPDAWLTRAEVLEGLGRARAAAADAQQALAAAAPDWPGRTRAQALSQRWARQQ